MAEKKKIMVIDDERDLCLLVKDNLEQKGRFEVVVVTDPLTVEEVCTKEQPDLILLDVVMPKRKGSDVAKSLKEGSQTKHIPIVIMSGLGEMVYFKRKDQWKWIPNQPLGRDQKGVVNESSPKRAAEAYGVDNYIAKPFSTDVLIEVIDDVLMRKKPA